MVDLAPAKWNLGSQTIGAISSLTWSALLWHPCVDDMTSNSRRLEDRRARSGGRAWSVLRAACRFSLGESGQMRHLPIPHPHQTPSITINLDPTSMEAHHLYPLATRSTKLILRLIIGKAERGRVNACATGESKDPSPPWQPFTGADDAMSLWLPRVKGRWSCRSASVFLHQCQTMVSSSS